MANSIWPTLHQTIHTENYVNFDLSIVMGDTEEQEVNLVKGKSIGSLLHTPHLHFSHTEWGPRLRTECTLGSERQVVVAILGNPPYLDITKVSYKFCPDSVPFPSLQIFALATYHLASSFTPSLFLQYFDRLYAVSIFPTFVSVLCWFQSGPVPPLQVQFHPHLLEERLDTLEGTKQSDFDATGLCLILNIAIPPKFKVPTFDKYEGLPVQKATPCIVERWLRMPMMIHC
ncbi:hypothetical protein CR513_44784, partial [Mucuna pruriens]